MDTKSLIVGFMSRSQDNELRDALKDNEFGALLGEIEKAKTSMDLDFINHTISWLGDLLMNIASIAEEKDVALNISDDNKESLDEAIDRFTGEIFSDGLEFDYKIYFIIFLFLTMNVLELGTRHLFIESAQKENIIQ